MLTAEQASALEWILREALEIAWERDLMPKDALVEATDLLLLAELLSHEELATSATELRDQAQKRLDAMPKPPARVELPLMLVLSTAHITRATAGLFEMKTDDLPIHHDKGEYGWIIPLNTGCDWPSTCPPELIKIRDYAERLGAGWIMLDRDAEIVSGLQHWDW